MATKKNKKRFTVLVENNIKNSSGTIVKQRFIYYFGSDSKGMAIANAAGLKRINHSYQVYDGEKLIDEFTREGFNAG